MPRGNDAQAAAQELAERFEGGLGNAEDILRSQRQARPPELRNALLKPVDQEATDDLREKGFESIESKASVDHVLDAAVRGDDIVFVGENGEGLEARTVKGVLVGGKKLAISDEDRHLVRVQALAKEGEKAAAKRSDEPEDEGDEYDQLTGADLDKAAADADIEGRSEMTADEKREALRKS